MLLWPIMCTPSTIYSLRALMLTHGGGPYHPHNSTSLHVAALNGNVNAVVALLDAGADINYRSGYYHSKNLSALDFALDNGEGGLNVNVYRVNQDGLMVPKVNTQHLRVAKILIERGAKVTSSNVRKLTALGVYDGGDRITAGIDRCRRG